MIMWNCLVVLLDEKRHCVEDYLPEKNLWRKKSPYPKTHNASYLAAITKLLDELVWDVYTNNTTLRVFCL